MLNNPLTPLFLLTLSLMTFSLLVSAIRLRALVLRAIFPALLVSVTIETGGIRPIWVLRLPDMAIGNRICICYRVFLLNFN